jgi:hypothetical protein
LRYYVTDGDVEEAEEQQAREAVRVKEMMKFESKEKSLNRMLPIQVMGICSHSATTCRQRVKCTLVFH